MSVYTSLIIIDVVEKSFYKNNIMKKWLYMSCEFLVYTDIHKFENHA